MLTVTSAVKWEKSELFQDSQEPLAHSKTSRASFSLQFPWIHTNVDLKLFTVLLSTTNTDTEYLNTRCRLPPLPPSCPSLQALCDSSSGTADSLWLHIFNTVRAKTSLHSILPYEAAKKTPIFLASIPAHCHRSRQVIPQMCSHSK